MKPSGHPHLPKRGHGAALLGAMLTVTLVATLAATALWRQWRQVEIEAAERVRQQSAWLLVGVQDWARQILREDALAGQTDHLSEPWAMRLEGVRLSGFLVADKNNTDNDLDASLSVQISDLQSRLNVNNLVDDYQVSEPVLQAFRKLFRLLTLPQSQLDVMVENLLLARGTHQASAPLLPQRVEQLTWLGLPASTLDALRPFIALLPERTPLNLNTASAEVIYASVPGLELGQAQRLISARTAAHFLNSELALQAAGLPAIPADAISLSVNSRFFEVRSSLRLAQSQMQERWLLAREESGVQVLSRAREVAGSLAVGFSPPRGN